MLFVVTGLDAVPLRNHHSPVENHDLLQHNVASAGALSGLKVKSAITMSRPKCWIIEDFDYRPSRAPSEEFTCAVALHTHSYHSEEELSELNDIMSLPLLRHFNEAFKRAFREKAKEELDYGNLHYSPPISPEEVYDLELESAKELGFEQMLLAITDHDKIAASQELIETRPDLQSSTVISEELSFPFNGQVFHLGVLGIPLKEADEVHKGLQEAAGKGELDEMFGLLRENGCLVILNHPLFNMKKVENHGRILNDLLARHGGGIDAFEYNGMRRHDENDRVLDLAQAAGKPVIGGGDRHTPLPSTVISATREATTFPDFFEEVREGRVVSICLRDYFKPHGWKMFVRILHYVKEYRRILFYKNVPITGFPIDDRILPDIFADISNFLLRWLHRLRLVG